MSIFVFARIIFHNLKSIIIIPLVMGVAMIWFTSNQPKEYASSALIYTGIASGYNIESGSDDKIDYHKINNAFDNILSIIKSRQILEEVGMYLLAYDLLEEKTRNQFPESIKSLYDSTLLLSATDLDKKAKMQYLLIQESLKGGNPALVKLLREENGDYSFKTLSAVDVKRHQSSDMLKLYYVSHSAVNSQRTLTLLIEVFMERYAMIKEAETGSVVAYFEEELRKAAAKLNEAENQLTAFRSSERVINYGEQTKAIAIKMQNALEEYTAIKMKLKSTEAALVKIEEKMGQREALLSKNAELMDKRNQLANYTQQLLQNQNQEEPYKQPDMQAKVNQLKTEIESSIHDVYNLSNTREGMPLNQLLNEWLNLVITLETEKSNVSFYTIRIKEINDLYDQFAPMGSRLARLEREIGVREREYLEILNSLNESKLKQQNIAMMSKLEVLDPPVFPSSALASKRAMAIVSVSMFGLFMVIAVLVAQRLLDQSLKSPHRAEQLTGLKVASALPMINDQLSDKNPELLSRLIGILINYIPITADTKSLAIASFARHHGKSVFSDLLKQELSNRGYQVVTEPPYAQAETTNAIRVIELPPLNSGEMVPQDALQADVQLLVFPASQRWDDTSQKSLENWERLTGQKPYLVLNGIQLNDLEEIIGSSPVPRNKHIVRIKQLLKFQFANTPKQMAS